MSEREKLFFGVVFSIAVFALLFVASGCAWDAKLVGPSLAIRSGAGNGPAEQIAGHPLGRSSSNAGSTSAARVMPISD